MHAQSNFRLFCGYHYHTTRALKCKTLGYVPPKKKHTFPSTVELKLYSTEYAYILFVILQLSQAVS